jgi:hypothetical protein
LAAGSALATAGVAALGVSFDLARLLWRTFVQIFHQLKERIIRCGTYERMAGSAVGRYELPVPAIRSPDEMGAFCHSSASMQKLWVIIQSLP